jgi:hypothetical protein
MKNPPPKIYGPIPIYAKWWSGAWMNDNILMVMAREEGWKQRKDSSATTAAKWLNSKGIRVHQVA